MRLLANSIYLTDKLHFVVKNSHQNFRTLLDRFIELSPTTNVDFSILIVEPQFQTQ